MKGATGILSSGITQCAITANPSGTQDTWDPKMIKIKANFFPAKLFMAILQTSKN